MNFLESSKSISSLLGGLSMVAKARHLSVSRPADKENQLDINKIMDI